MKSEMQIEWVTFRNVKNINKYKYKKINDESDIFSASGVIRFVYPCTKGRLLFFSTL